jgi:hypothetical protein
MAGTLVMSRPELFNSNNALTPRGEMLGGGAAHSAKAYHNNVLIISVRAHQGVLSLIGSGFRNA